MPVSAPTTWKPTRSPHRRRAQRLDDLVLWITPTDRTSRHTDELNAWLLQRADEPFHVRVPVGRWTSAELALRLAEAMTGSVSRVRFPTLVLERLCADTVVRDAVWVRLACWVDDAPRQLVVFATRKLVDTICVSACDYSDLLATEEAAWDVVRLRCEPLEGSWQLQIDCADDQWHVERDTRAGVLCRAITDVSTRSKLLSALHPADGETLVALLERARRRPDHPCSGSLRVVLRTGRICPVDVTAAHRDQRTWLRCVVQSPARATSSA